MKQLLKTKVVVPVLAIGLFLTTTAFKSDFFEIAKQIEIFTTLFKELNMNYVDETNPAELMDSAIKNMLEELDPYTVFLNEQDVEAYKINNAGEYSGIGALVRSYEDRLVIVEPYKGYPADRAGLKAGDEIVTIGDISVADFKDDAAELLKGANNSSVSVSFLRQGKLQSTTVERSAIEVDAVPFYRMADDKTGYIVLSRFNSKASSQTEEALLDLKEQGAERIILDLRGNPGGLLSEAINVTNLFVPKGELIVTTKSKVAKFNQEYETRKRPVDTEIPLAILVDGQSASASEIVSGGLQDLDRAVIIGARSFGKGLVQRPLKLTYGTQLKVTISRYYTPSGRCIQALDYWNRDESGNAVRNTEFQEFKTRNGRKVTDGGGVQPDIPIDELKSNELIRALVQNHVIFDFATKYYYDHTLDNPAEFELTPAVYQEFTDHVTGSSFSFETRTEKALEKALTDREEVIFTETIENDFKTLLADIEKSKLRALDTYSDEITRQLEDEIIKRYFYREGLYEYYLEKDAAILTAREVLGQPRRYSEILQGP
ncbi:S41 family peptidase [Robiginitalea biformata]|uniref:Carboxy-terminal processing protease n=1 Tax=Robiginitalea biformata (strain ATCC BAA-864 / DSM 15991 / KCTC 12146 / HTCC2501) TaxID=313596 RepID=A4CI60_ROBBH|nr:S41 family peptidase [Robiginitalea biformata]EAR16618.1 carboxy-terminal processing protease precursor [Robiginitalea biformata HTCC2501]